MGVAAADVADRTAVGAAVAACVEARGPCDVLVTAAGGARPGYFEQLDDSVFREQMEVDYFGTLHAVRAVAASMIERRSGHIVHDRVDGRADRCVRLFGLRAGEVSRCAG